MSIENSENSALHPRSEGQGFTARIHKKINTRVFKNLMKELIFIDIIRQQWQPCSM